MPSIDPQASASTIQVGPEGRFNCDHGAPTHSPPSVGNNSNSSALTPVARSAHSAAGHSPIGREEGLVSLRDLALLNRRKFKVHGGYIGDNSADISCSVFRLRQDTVTLNNL